MSLVKKSEVGSMRFRYIACPIALVLGAAAVAHADVSLTDQQTFAKGPRYTARSSNGISAPLAVGQVPRLIDGTGLEWFINDEVAYVTESSAVGAASDAVFVGAVEATTANGGTELAVLADAFDGYNALQVSVDGGSAVAYNNLGTATSDCNGRQIIMPVLSSGGVSVQRKVYIPGNDGFARWMNVVTNGSADPHTVTLRMVSDLGSDAGTTIGTTSSGDAIADINDDWVTSYEAFLQNSSRTPRLAHVLQSPGSAVRVSTLSFVNGNDKPVWSYDLTVPAGGTVTVLNFVAGLGSRPDAALKAAQLAALPPWARVCMSSTETATLSNMSSSPLPTGPAPLGPAGITITSPTTEASFTASGPFLAIGGVAGPAHLTGVTWSSNRGFTGTAQGSAEWTIPAAALLPGTNIITVTAGYEGGAPISDTITIVRDALTYLLPEGSTGTFFHTDVLIANPNNTEVEADVRFLRSNGASLSMPVQILAPKQRVTIPINSVPGLELDGPVSTVVTSESGAPLLVERTMFWDTTSYGSHGAIAQEGASTRFLFGEGATGFFSTFVLLANNNPDPATASVTFLPESGLPVSREVNLPARSRTTVAAGDIPELANASFSITVDASAPISAERAMYFGTAPLFKGGHDSPGVTLPANQWFFGEGATGGFFDTFVLLGNPSVRTANVKMTYQLAGGGTVVVNRTVAPFGRTTLNTAFEDPALASTTFALAVESNEPIIAERSMYWDRSVGEWYEAHNSFGVNEPGMKWGLAEGRAGTARGFRTYILIGNTTEEESQVRLTFLRSDPDDPAIAKNYLIPANSRVTVDVTGEFPQLLDQEFGAILEVTDGSPIIVERSLYSAAGGQIFGAGTNTQAIRLP
jgi:hypothetical protein